MAFEDLSFGLLQFRGHGSWLVCEVALRSMNFIWSIFPTTLNIPISVCYYLELSNAITIY